MKRNCVLGMLLILFAPPVMAQDKTEPAEARMQMRQRQQRAQNNRRSPVYEVKDPAEFTASEGKTLFSGPQAGERLPAFQAIGVHGKRKETNFDPTEDIQDEPHVLIFMDDGGVGVRGLFGFIRALETIRDNTDKDLRLTTIFLGDDSSALSGFVNRFSARLSESATVGISIDGRDGPGNYGLNRNVAMTVLVAKDGKVTHNFPMTQAMLYPDPHVLGAVAEVLGEDRESMASWFRKQATTQQARPGMRREDSSMKNPAMEKKVDWEARFAELIKSRPAIRAKLASGQTTKEEVIRWLQNGGDRVAKNKRYFGQTIKVSDPSEYVKSMEKVVFSGPQAGEVLPSLKAIGYGKHRSGESYDPVAEAAEKPLVLFLQNESVVGMKGLYLNAAVLQRIAAKSQSGLQVSVVFLVDDPATLESTSTDMSMKAFDRLPLAYSVDGRDGPGNYGLNRNVAMTVIVAKQGKVL
ncbi:MAG: hypothetical protein AAF989_10275, partial [Planctomycetota bacterium]